MKPYENQLSSIKHIVDNYKRLPLIESPTGSGKTHILYFAALELIKKGHKVIISTPNNKLCIDGYKKAKEDWSNENGKLGFTIGSSNYIDITKYQNCINSHVLTEYIEEESLKKWESINELNKDDDEYLLFDDFDEIVEYKDIAYSSLVKSLITREEIIEDNDFSNFDLTYTNHFYLIFRASITRNINLKEYIVLFDEVHELPQIAETVVQNKFSPFFLGNILKGCLKDINASDDEFQGKNTLIKELRNGISIASDFIGKAMSFNRQIGEIATPRDTEKYIAMLKSFDNYQMKELLPRINKMTKKGLLKGKRKQLFHAAINELRELSEVLKSSKVMESGNSVSIYFSPSKGYPTYLTNKVSPSSILKFGIWERVLGAAGVSATINTTAKISDLKNKKFAYARLGISPDDAMEIKTVPRIFNKELVHIVQKPIKLYTTVSDDEESSTKEKTEQDASLLKWSEEIASHVKETYSKKNSMVITGSFKEAEAIHNALVKVLPKENIIYAQSGLKTVNGVKRFIEQGGILVGTRNYGTGISLDGKLLERLYITKLPYPISTSKKWQDLKSKGMPLFWLYYNNEMLTLFRQYLGRLQRTNKDEGEIHLLDSRGIKGELKCNENLINLIQYFLFQYGVEVKKEDKKKIKRNILEEEDEVDYF